MNNLWNNKEAKKYINDDLSLRVYSSRLLGQNSELVLHGGGNTSVKGTFKNIFEDSIETLFIKGSGWDLINIEKEGFTPVRLDHLLHLATLSTLTDTEMVREQRLATLDPRAPNASVEAILHALIPFKYVDHTHADSVLAITNTPGGKQKIKEIYGPDILIIPYVMPGFVLAKKIVELTENTDWKQLRGMILLNHGVFSFAETAKKSYDRMINIVNAAELYLKRKHSWKHYAKSKAKPDLLTITKIRRLASLMTGSAVISKVNYSSEASGFSSNPDSASLSLSGTLTPDHVIRTKPFPWIIGKNLEHSANKFKKKYKLYFDRNGNSRLTMLNSGPKWALWPHIGTISFGKSNKEANIINDINKHTFRAMQVSESLHKWKPLPLNKLFEVEYWELEQSKLKKENSSLPFQGQISLITGVASGIGKACAGLLLEKGCVVVGIDKSHEVIDLFQNNSNYKGYICDVTNPKKVQKLIENVICSFGGLDILISNAGIFPDSELLENISENKWKKDIDINLTSHYHVLRKSIPFLKNGVNSSVVFIGTRNVGAPGLGAGTYTIAKSGLTQMCRLAAIELAPYNVRVNIVHPDCVYDTALWTEKTLNARAEKYGISVDQYKTRNLMKKPVHSIDVAEVVCFLSGRKSSKTTGAQLPVDGGNDRII